MAYTLSQSKYSKFNSLNYNQLFQNPYEYKPGKLSKETRQAFTEAYQNTRTPKFEAPVQKKRSILDRTIDTLMVSNYTLAGGINNLIDDDDETGFWGGVWDGLKASNPFGKGNEKGEVTFSKVLDTAGWEPESGLGKFARGTVGFGLDVVLDPTTYIGGAGLVIKGTGKVGQTGKAVDKLAKEYAIPAELLNKTGKLDKMTPEVAEHILKNSSRAEALTKLNKTDYQGTIEAFTKTYNRALGLRETGEVTLSLRNVPFGDKIVDKFFGKNSKGGITLAKSNKGLMTIGKYSGASHVYGATRNFLMGRKMIQKLSTTARYSALAKTDPIQLFDAVTFLRSTKGQQKSIRKATQEVIRKSSVMAKLTPAEQDAVIKLVEDPDNWNLVNKVIDEAEVKTYEELRASMGKDLEELIARRQTMEDTYDAVVSDLTVNMQTHREEVARQLRERGEIKSTIKEKQYELDWIQAEREQKLAELGTRKTQGFEDLDKIRDERIAINNHYEAEMHRIIQEQDQIQKSLDDTINSLAHERALEVSKGGYEIVHASKELIDHELSVLGEQFAKKQSDIEQAIASKELSFEEAQMMRTELSAELEAEAKRIYGRKYYQVKKAKATTSELAEQEKALGEALEALEAMKAKGAGKFSAEEARTIDASISELKNERSRLLSEISELKEHTKVQEKVKEISSAKKFLETYLNRSFSIDTRFDGKEFSEIQTEIGEQYKKAISEAFMNDDAKAFATFELSELQKLGIDPKNPYDAIADKVSFEQMNQLRGMLSELIVGGKSLLHLRGGDAFKLAEFIMTDAKDKDSMIKFFQHSGDLFVTTAKKDLKEAKVVRPKEGGKVELDTVSAEYLANTVEAVGHLPMLRELTASNYGRISGLDGQFYNHLSSNLGYNDFFKDVHLKMEELVKKQHGFESRYEKAMSELGNIDMLSDTAQTVLQRVAKEGEFDYNKLINDMKVAKPNAMFQSQKSAIDELTAKIESETMGIIDGQVRANANELIMLTQQLYKTDQATASNIVSDVITKARGGDLDSANTLENLIRTRYQKELNSLLEKHQKYVKEQEALSKVEVYDYNLETAKGMNEFADELANAVMKQMPEYYDTVARIDNLMAIRQVRAEESRYFLSLNHVEKTSYLKSVKEEGRINNFVQGMFNREFERARETRFEQWANDPSVRGRKVDGDQLDRYNSHFGGNQAELDLGTGKKYNYSEILDDTKDGSVRNRFFGKYVTESYDKLPSTLKARIDELNKIASDVYAPVPRSKITKRTLVSHDKESMSAFISNVISGRLTHIDVDSLYKTIDEQLAKKAEGMDKRTKPYRELKKKAEDMRRAVDRKAYILRAFSSNPKVLEVSSKGDKRFSAFYAKINFGEKNTSIEDIYQSVKRFDGKQLSTKEAKGKKPTSMVFEGKEFPIENLSKLYDALWLKYFADNPELLSYVRQFDDFNDMFKGKAFNTQEDTIRRIANQGMENVYKSSEDFIKSLGKDSQFKNLESLTKGDIVSKNPISKNSKGSVFANLTSKETLEYIESFGLTSMERIDKVKSELFKIGEREANSGNISKTGAIMREINKRIEQSAKSLDEMYKLIDADDVKMQSALSDKLLEHEELLLIKQLFNFSIRLDGDRNMLSAFASSLSNAKRTQSVAKKEVRQIIKENEDLIFSIRNSSQDLTKAVRGVEMIVPHLTQARHQGYLYSELKPNQQFKLVEDAYNILRKQFNGEPPSSVEEMLKVMGDKSLDEVKKRDLTKAYDKFMKQKSEDLYVSFLDDQGKLVTGRLVDSDGLSGKYTDGLSIKVDVVTREGYGRNTTDVPFDRIVRTGEDTLRSVFNTLDENVERQLIETRQQLETFKSELAERLAREETNVPQLQKQVDTISDEITKLYQSRNALTSEYHAKLAEMENLVQTLKQGIDTNKAKLAETTGQIEDITMKYLQTKQASHIAKFDEADPFATAVPGTPEWDKLMDEIIEKDPDLKELFPQYEKAQEVLMKWADIDEMWKVQKEGVNSNETYDNLINRLLDEGVDEADLPSRSSVKVQKKELYTRDVNPEKVRQAKETAEQFESLLKQKALGFQKGDGFILFREKMELMEEWGKVRDELASKSDELNAKKAELTEQLKQLKSEELNSKARQKRSETKIEKLEGQMKASEGEEYLLKARTEDELAQLDKEIDKLQKRDAKLGREYDKYNKQINETVDTIHEEIALLQREHARLAKEAQEGSAERISLIRNGEQNVATLEAEVNKLNDEILKLQDAMESNEALDTILRMDFGDDLADAIGRKSQGLPAYKFAIEDSNIPENIKRFAIEFKEEMIRIGREEISIGKLSEEQFASMIDHYFPRVLSEDGERFFAEKRELLEAIRPLTADYGFNTKFNNHAIGRVEELRHMGIKEVNDFFEQNPEYGIRIFEENLARAYVGRSIKHAELMYDDEYTKIIMDVAGHQPVKKSDGTFDLKSGYEHVANFGHIREHIRQMVDAKIQLTKQGGTKITDEMIGQFEKEAVDYLKIDPKLLDEYKMPMVKLEGEALERLHSVGLARQMSKQIVEEANSARMLTIKRDESKMLQLFDKFTIWLKAMQTAVMPSFHIRNFQGNLFQNWLAVGSEAFNPKMIKETFKISRNIQDRDFLAKLEPIRFVDKDGNGQVIHWTQIVDEAVVHGVINEGFFAKDFDGYAKSSGLLGGGKWDFTSTDNFAPIKKGFEVGTLVENQGRLAQFASLLKQGHDFETASEIVTKYLFDYSDLTHFEKTWMKRIFPYYTWMRKNSVLQVRELINQPNKYAQIGKFGQSMENSADPDNTIEDQYISNYARDWLVTPFTMKNKDGVEEPVLFNSNLPYKDLANLPFDPFNIVDSMRGLVAQTSPVFKKPIEAFTNYNIHYDSPIIYENSDNPFTPMVNHVLTELAWYNAVSGFMKQDTAGDKFLSGLNTLGGIKMSSYDYEANKRRTVEKAWEDYYGNFFGMSLNSAQMRITDAMTWEVKSALSKQIVKLAGLPLQAGEYSNALAPISEETYNSLSDKEKRKYTKPTDGEMGYINQRALELSQQTYNESGKLKKFGWMMIEAIDVPYKNPIHTVRVNEVVDGDTLRVSYNGTVEDVRLLLVDTPESKGKYEDNPMAYGKESSEYTKQMVLGKDVKLYLDGTDSYGRLLAFVEQDDSSLNEELLREGLAKVRYLFERDDNNYDVQKFREIEEGAYKQGKGIWSIPGYAQPGDEDYRGGRSSR